MSTDLRAYKTIVVSFGGAFRVANQMTYVRAFDETGAEHWKIEGNLPSRDSELIVGDAANLALFASGRYALFGKASTRNSCEIIDLKDGAAVSVIGGWPLATSRDNSVALVRDEDGTLSLIRIN